MDARYPRSLTDAIVYFRDYENCRRFMIEMRWPDGIVRCPTCESDKVTYLANQRRWKCYSKHPRPQFTLKVGTIFEDSPIPLEKWLPAMWLLANCKNGISSYELADALEVTQKTAWFMLQRLRLAMQDDKGGNLSGNVEVDESFIGGKARNMHAHRRAAMGEHKHSGKEIVFGMIERDGKVRTLHVEGRRKHELQQAIRENVEAGSAIFSDELLSYEGLTEDYDHSVINHAVEYASGNVHTNTMENFWSLLKRCLKGTYISVEPFHLFRYLDEQVFRFNHRKESSTQRFIEVAQSVAGRRLTYKDLIGQGSPSLAPLSA